MAMRQPTLRALIIALGLSAGGWLAGLGFARGRMTDRFVTVKGLSERTVKANLALWPLRIVTTDNDLGRAQVKATDSISRVRNFLSHRGIDATAAELQKFEVTDAYADPSRDVSKISSRYVVHQTLMVRSDHPDQILEASQQVGELVKEGVVLSAGAEYGSSGPTFLFTGLNDVKPTMLGEATTRAREAARKFAEDSGSTLGRIRTAEQGVFEIMPRDQAPGIQEGDQLFKTVRVVSTIEYFLRD